MQYVLKKLGIGFLKVSRNPSGAEAIHYSAVDEKVLSEFPVIINCSPLGMSPNEQTKPGIAYDAITHGHYLFDLVYQPAETMFLTEGKQRGATVKNGYEMLLIQAEENWRIWRGDSY